MATFIDGIAASENIDSSGERIQIAGMDISSLAMDGVFTYEHEAATGPKGEKLTVKLPEQTVGKILKAKKIFSEADCEDDREHYFWQKCQTPYIYIMGELFDDYTDAARDLAGKFRYDQDRLNQNERTVMNFSIEGAYIAKQGIEVTRSVARKCTITVLPCNKAARAEMIPAKENSKDSLDWLSPSQDKMVKTEAFEIELFKTESKAFVMPAPMNDIQKHADILGIEPMKKNVVPFKKPLTSSPTTPTKPAPAAAAGSTTPKLPGATNNAGRHIGATKSGKSIMSHAKIHEYHGFSGQDHQDAANLHHTAAQASNNAQAGAHHLNKMKLHLQAAKTSEHREARFSRAQAQPSAISNLNKTLEAGSGNVAPGQLTQGAALAKEHLLNKPVFSNTNGNKMRSGSPGLKAGMGTSHMGSHVRRNTEHNTNRAKEIAQKQLKNLKAMPKPKLEKSDWLARAEEEYQNWDKREEFQSFMAARLPNLTKSEIDAIGKTLALKKSVDTENALSKLSPMSKALKFGSEEDQKAVAAAIEERKKNPPKKAAPKVKAPELKGEVHSEVSHTTSSVGHTPTGTHEFDTVHLKSGHESHGHPKGKFKAGDKVTIKPHLMGTHILEHKKD